MQKKITYTFSEETYYDCDKLSVCNRTNVSPAEKDVYKRQVHGSKSRPAFIRELLKHVSEKKLNVHSIYIWF